MSDRGGGSAPRARAAAPTAEGGAGRGGATVGHPGYTRYHPRWYRRRMPIFWWLGRPAYTKFVARELTSVAVAYAVLLLVAWSAAVGRGPEAYAAFLDWLSRPWVIGLNALAFLALLFHTVTWLGLAPKALVLRLGGRRLPDRAVVAGHYLAWLLASALIAWLLVWRG